MSRLTNAKPAVRPSDANRFWAKVDPSGVCWEWTAARGPIDGYGRFAVQVGGFNRNGRPAWRALLAHRVAYALLVGPVPDGMQIDHLCRNRGCVNPDHLEVVTPSVNVHRSSSPIRYQVAQTKCLRGHPLEAPNMYVDSRNKRVCRQCYRDRRTTKKEVSA